MSRKSEPLPLQTVRIVDKLRGDGLDWPTVGVRVGIPYHTLQKKYKQSKDALGEKIGYIKGTKEGTKDSGYDPDRCHYKVCRGCRWWRTVGSLGRVCNFTADTGIMHRVRDCQIAGRRNHPDVKNSKAAEGENDETCI